MQKILWVFILFGFVVSCADKEAEKEIAQKQSQLEKVNLQFLNTLYQIHHSFLFLGFLDHKTPTHR